jgi:creatinine amidohydrolase
MILPADGFRMADMTAAGFAEAARRQPVILLPLGSQEDHGPFLPMGDFLLAEILAGRIAQAAAARGTPALVAPGLAFGAADYFGASAGGLALSAATFGAVLGDLLEGLLRHGLTRIVLLNGHGGNAAPIHGVTSAILRDTGVAVPSFYLWKIARQLLETRMGPGQDARFGHGAEPLLSLSLALRPGQVNLAAAVPDVVGEVLGLPVTDFGTVQFQGAPVGVPVGFEAVPRDASRAALPQASAALGQAVADELVALAADFVVHVANDASASGVSKSRSTESLLTGTSRTESR